MRPILVGFLFILLAVSAVAQTRPNIIVILADDMGYSDIGCFGSEIDTPNIDRIGLEGLRFTHFYNTGRCSPTRAALLTGHYAQRAGLGHLDEDWKLPGYLGYIADTSATLAEVLGSSGYQTFMSGKWHVGKAAQHQAPARGFQRVFHSPNGGGIYFTPFQFNRPLFLDDTEVAPGADFYSTDAFTDYALQFIDEALADPEGDPFFMYLPYIAPHFPLQAPADDVQKYLDRGTYANGWEPIRKARFAKQQLNGIALPNWSLSAEHNHVADWAGMSAAQRDRQEQVMATYAGMIDRLDQNVGRILAKLDAEGVADDTLILFCSDNGAEASASPFSSASIGDPVGGSGSSAKLGRSWANAANTPFRRFKSSNQEGGIVSPMVVRWPSGISRPPGEVERTPGHVIDLMATFVEIGGASYPGAPILPSDGVSLRPLFAPGGSIVRSAPLFFEHEGERAVVERGWKLHKTRKGAWSLFNLSSDPQEESNLAASDPARVSAMSSQWLAWAESSNVKLYPPRSQPFISTRVSKALAAEQGNIAGQITFTRTGRTRSSLTLALEVTGTATPGVDYAAIPDTVTIPSGSASTTLSITTIGDAENAPAKTVIICVKPKIHYNEPAQPATVTITDRSHL